MVNHVYTTAATAEMQVSRPDTGLSCFVPFVRFVVHNVSAFLHIFVVHKSYFTTKPTKSTKGIFEERQEKIEASSIHIIVIVCQPAYNALHKI